MFIRRKPNRTGSFTVEVVIKDVRSRSYRVIRTYGISYKEEELLCFERQARDFIDVGKVFQFRLKMRTHLKKIWKCSYPPSAMLIHK